MHNIDNSVAAAAAALLRTCLCPPQVWVYGNSFKSVLVAVVVPKEESIKAWAAANGKSGEWIYRRNTRPPPAWHALHRKSRAAANRGIQSSAGPFSTAVWG
jgi:hypothetical protein